MFFTTGMAMADLFTTPKPVLKFRCCLFQLSGSNRVDEEYLNQKLKEVFEDIDGDNSGTIDFEELKIVRRTLVVLKLNRTVEDWHALAGIGKDANCCSRFRA